MTSAAGFRAGVARFVAAAFVASSLALMAGAAPAAAENPPSFITSWGTQGSASGEFQEPYAVAVDADGNVYVADTVNQRIQKFTSTGTFITSWGTPGSGNGQFSDPYGLTVDGLGNVYVADEYNHRIQKFTSNGTFITKWGSNGTGNGQFQGPVGVAVDSNGNVYVADNYNHRIQKFTSNGTFITKWGTLGSGDGQFNRAYGLAIDGHDNVYVADYGNDRIQKFTSNGTFITKWGTLGSGDGQFNIPVRVAVDARDNIYVNDTNNYRVQKFTSTGTFVTKWGIPGSGNGQFAGAYGVAVDAVGNVYVADTGNHRIQRFGDLTNPTVTIATPVEGATYARNRAVAADFSCADEAGGSGIATCVGTAADGSPVNTSALGSHDFTVTATDNAGNTRTVTHTYTVIPDVTDPAVDLRTPPDGAVYSRNQAVTADFACADEAGGSGIATCVGTVADGSSINTSTLGPHDFTVTATDRVGNTRTVTHTYTVVDVTDPTVDLRTPPDGEVFDRNQTVAADFSCADEAGGSGIATCAGTVPDGSAINTSTLGPKNFTVTATDNAGNHHAVTHTYTVVDGTDPSVDLRTPPGGAVYARNQVVAADFSCADESGGSGIDTCVGTVADGSAIDTSTLGPKNFTVTATDNAGNTTEITHAYTVEDGTDPTVDLVTPPDGAVYARNQAVAADFSCADEVGGSGIDTCVGTVADGSAIDTSTVGDHDFTVTATDVAANSTEVTHTYTVADPRPDGRIRRGATGRYVGDDLYNTTGVGQTRTGSAVRGGTVTYFVSVQNDALYPDVLRLRGTSSSSRFRVTYSTGGIDLTSGVTAGIYTTPTLNPGETLVVKVEVKVKAAAPVGSSLNATVTARSTTDAAVKDTVRFNTSRR